MKVECDFAAYPFIFGKSKNTSAVQNQLQLIYSSFDFTDKNDLKHVCANEKMDSLGH